MYGSKTFLTNFTMLEDLKRDLATKSNDDPDWKEKEYFGVEEEE